MMFRIPGGRGSSKHTRALAAAQLPRYVLDQKIVPIQSSFLFLFPFPSFAAVREMDMGWMRETMEKAKWQDAVHEA